MATKDKPLSDDQVLSIVDGELESAAGFTSGELSQQRSNAMDRYLGEKYGTEVEGESQVRTREVLDTVEWILPSLVRIFCDADNLVKFEPVGAEDVDQCEQESDVCNHVFWKQNEGFYNLYTSIKDGLVSKTGVMKVYYDDTQEESREEYDNLNDIELALLVDADDKVREVTEYEQNEDGTHHVVFACKRDRGQIKVAVMPPEEFGVSRDASSPFPQDARFSFHRSRKTASDLVEMGIPIDKVKELPGDDNVETEERLSRRNLTDEQEALDVSDHWSMRMIWVTESYIKLDRNGDGIAEWLKVLTAGGGTTGDASVLLDIEDVDGCPFFAYSPVLLTHKFYGLSISDLVEDVQEIKTALLRGMLNNAYLANNSRTAVNEKVILDDLLVSRAGGVVRTRGDTPPGQHIMPLPNNPLPTETFGLLEYLDELTKRRTGGSDDLIGLDKGALAEINTGVLMAAFDAARMKIELIARIIAEVQLKPMFAYMHELMRKYVQRDLALQLRGQWVQVDPSKWDERTDLSVTVGVGQVTRERKLVALDAIMEKQMIAIQNSPPGMMTGPDKIHQALKDYTEAWGLQNELYWNDPEQWQAPPQQGPDAEQDLMAAQAQALIMDAQAKQTNAQVNAMKAQGDQQAKGAELQLKHAELQLRSQEMALRAQDAEVKATMDRIAQAVQMQKEQSGAQAAATKAAIDGLKVRGQLQQDERDRMQAKYEADLRAAVEVYKTEAAQAAQAAADQAPQATSSAKDESAEALAGILERLEGLAARLDDADAPREVIYDSQGLIASIGKKKITRDADGRATSIG